jgi:hypothetical protein
MQNTSPGNKPQSTDTLIRHAGWAKLRKDEDDNVIGILAVAFELRSGETYLSSTWMEHFGGISPANLYAAVGAIRASRDVGKKSGFALGLVGEICAACSAANRNIRVVREPEDNNSGHTAVRKWPRDNLDLLQLMATDTWSRLAMNSSIP